MRFHIADVSPGRIRLEFEGERDAARHDAFIREAARIPGVRAIYTRWPRNTLTVVVDPRTSREGLVRRIEALIRSAHVESADEQASRAAGALPEILERRAREIEAHIANLQRELREVTRKRDRLRAVVGVYERALDAERRAAERDGG